MTSYYRCDGSVTSEPSGAVACSSGWLAVDEPVYSLASQDQVSELILALVCLWGLIKVFSILLNLLGVQK